MAQVTVTINGREYQVACDDGQEAHLTRLGSYVDNRIGELVAAVGQVGDARLLVMVSLLLADELSDVYAELEVARTADAGASAMLSAEENLSANIEDLAQRIETIAERLEQA
ncbi:MAG: cell division protein ZapA [Rhodospirillales bacterium]|nr:cell division protein ZapA [Alphaproteobacteria bacterium]MBL6947913.1 cell division protein ZapA [Rhodospirillales bacterium]